MGRFQGNFWLSYAPNAETRCGISLMDQERDTIGNPKSSQKGRIWQGNSPSTPQSSREQRLNQPHSSPDRQGIDATTVKTSSPADLSSDALPTLFELPDRTPEHLQRRRERSQLDVHDAHAGPPAGHVDPPSGNHSFLDQPGPTEPTNSRSALPGADPLSSESGSANESQAATEGQVTPDQKVAAFHDHSSSSSEDARAWWVIRSAIVMLVLMMVTLAFFSGRGFRGQGLPSDDRHVTDAEAAPETLAETIVMLDDPSTFPSASFKGLLPEPTALSGETDLPSYLADATLPAPSGSLGQPLAPSLSNEPNATTAGNLENPQDFPPIPSSPDAVVAFRAMEASVVENANNSDNLPAGMSDRLNLQDGLRYTDTPFPIGNLLEILSESEASEPQ
jgi:hypothetical protein